MIGNLESFADALFSDGWPSFLAIGLIISVFGLELGMNVRNGEGWAAIAHLAVIGPLWLFLVLVTLIALRGRLMRRRAGGIGRDLSGD